jgi:hypothetical protein
MLCAAMAEQLSGTPLVLRPEDPTARKGALLFAVLAVIGLIGLVVEIATGNTIGAIAAAIIAVAGVLLTIVVVIGRTTMRVTVDADCLQVAAKRLPRADIAGLRRRPIREGGLDVVGRDDTVLYSMPAWFDAAQEQQLAAALGVVIVEPPPPSDTETETGETEQPEDDATV